MPKCYRGHIRAIAHPVLFRNKFNSALSEPVLGDARLVRRRVILMENSFLFVLTKNPWNVVFNQRSQDLFYIHLRINLRTGRDNIQRGFFHARRFQPQTLCVEDDWFANVSFNCPGCFLRGTGSISFAHHYSYSQSTMLHLS